ncbi:hypothetical protein [Enterococcus pallens]|uniref:Uncharacterized protein n=1 Tax=Enterococcus pallens ATCC BAA-351 TaxID=1158607 RepID=R2SPU9_9ENTE|nr:hypothetical protein [Enterococcus pallens]EOH94831.1 hypothetical protein UAU_01753 [Enterococcus pallens ATCC BAA-351]EOU14850.1 hypothetical protein I588_04500 [Enterococcus pallens ATCC BAA-351]OJG76226.1 hypothetical protein RV10_GL004133 [Enterococcus pallens]
MFKDMEPKEILTLTLSILALLISVSNWIRDWKRITVNISKKDIIKRVESFDAVPAFPNQSLGVGIALRFLNTSKYSMGFFDLVFRDGYSNELLPCFLTYSLRPDIAKEELLGITYKDEVAHLNTMYSNYGVIPSNSCVNKETIVYPISDKIRINIKFAKFFPIPNFFSKTNRFSKWKSVVIKLDKEEIKVLQSHSSEQESESSQE